MAFLGIFFVVMPLLITMSLIAFALMFLFGISLVAIGVSGKLMNKLYSLQANTIYPAAKHSYNTLSIVLGICFMLFPVAVILFSFLGAVLS